jgi:hypothetical protein
VALNGGTSSDGTTISGCFADHCDWRLPTIVELQMILLEPYPCGTDPCIDPVFGPTQSNAYRSASTYAPAPNHAWYVDFRSNGAVGAGNKTFGPYVRAVRGDLWSII